MKESHIVFKMPTWITCCHKDNLRKRKNEWASYKDGEWYKFAIIRNEKYENSDSFIAGYFRWKSDKLHLDRYLFRVEGIYLDEVYTKSVEKYKHVKAEGFIIPSKCLEEEIWMGHSPYDVKPSDILHYKP